MVKGTLKELLSAKHSITIAYFPKLIASVNFAPDGKASSFATDKISLKRIERSFT